MLRNYAGGLLYFLALYFCSFFGSILLMGPTLPLLWLRPRWFRWINDRLIISWLFLPPALLEVMFGVKIVITGDKPPKNENSIIIMNHRCRLDWMFYWNVAARYGGLQQEKIIMKHELKHIPGPGWAMQNALYIFLRRCWEQDESYLNRVLSYYVSSPDNFQLLLFPEGTNFEDGSKSKSDLFARKNNLPCYEYVLHPRLRGFTYCVEKLRQGRLNAIHDVTIGYSKNYCFKEMDLLRGNVPDEIHFHIQRYSNVDLPQDVEGMEKWCCEQWKNKEERLRKFYTQGHRFEPPTELASETETTVRHLFVRWMLIWGTFMICTSILMYMSAQVRWFVFIMGATCFVLSLCGGTDKLFLLTQQPLRIKTK